MKKYIWGIIYSAVISAFTIYILLDTFVITKVYVTIPQTTIQNNDTASYSDESSKEKSDSSITAENSDEVNSQSSYKDENISISINEYRQNDTTIYVADIQLSSSEYLKTAFAENAYGRNVTAKTSEIAKSNNAILAINGDYYGSQEQGYVVRNGVLYRDICSDDKESLVIYQDGDFDIIQENNISAEELIDNGAEHILSFGPALVEDGNIAVTENEEVGKAKASNPRTAIGIIDKLHYVFVVSDGRTNESKGLSLYELAEFMDSLNVSCAYNLDGGGSSTIYFNGEVINNPTTNGKKIKERSVSDIVYIGY